MAAASVLRPRALAVAAILLAGIGAWQVAGGAWIYAKAALAGILLDRAWTRTVAGGTRVRPWPWADSWPVARLRFGSTGDRETVLAGASGAALAFGPGHVAGTPAPGAPGNSVIAGHRDTSFAVLGRLKVGDAVSLQTRDGRWRRYRVSASAIIDATRPWHPPEPPPGRSMLSLVTCWPLDAIVPGGPMRYVLFAEEG